MKNIGKEIGELREKVKKIEKENSTLKNFTSSIFNDNIEEEFIPKQKIKDKIEELRNDIKNQNCRFPYIVEHKIDVLQELLLEEDK